MRLSNIALTVATAGSVVAAQPHRHAHRNGHAHLHEHKRAAAVDVVTVPGPTVYAFEYEGQNLSQEQVCQGIADGTLEWAAGTEDPPNCATLTASSSTAPSTTSTPTSSPSASSSTIQANELLQVAKTSTTTSAPAAKTTAATAPAATTTAAPAPAAPVSGIANNPNVDSPFPDGQLDCSTFPSAYGAIDVSWMGLGGWSGIQIVQTSGNAVTNIVTAKSGPCANTADGIAMCSYACPPGYQKSQWPSTQGSTGQSVGGLMCGSDGKLHLTNPGLSNKLCIPGTGAVSVKNTLGSNVAICRTDYPGTEDETVPLDTQPGSESPLTCPDEKTYYQHLGSPTSAQYYINPAGTPVDQACQWSTNGTDVGNFAPSYLGAGTDASGKTWLAITSTQQQNPANYQPLDYTIELQGNFGGSNACFLVVQGGTAYYCSSGSPSNFDKSNCETFVKCDGSGGPCNEAPGCTVMVESGQTAKYVLY